MSNLTPIIVERREIKEKRAGVFGPRLAFNKVLSVKTASELLSVKSFVHLILLLTDLWTLL